MGNQYKATIITPFHNTDMSLFMETYKSVKEQTIGFSNIEWIIVLHNCEKEYIDAVRNLLGGYDNVILKELNNDARSASSPRNHALKFVTSPYLEFLDSDDYINTKTLETCIEAMERNQPDMVIFRMAYVRQNDSVRSLITDVNLWNPLETEMVLTGEKIRSDEIFSALNVTTHPRVFSSEFVLSNHLTFDEKITMAEDAYFIIESFSKAKKIVILPQFIGHYYYVNDNSAVQSVGKLQAKDVLHFGYGFKKIFDCMIEMKASYNYLMLKFLWGIVYNAYTCGKFKQKDWEQLQQEMAPYARMIRKPPVNNLFSKEEGEMIYEFVISNILEPHKEDDVDFYNGENALMLALKTNENTAIGKFYHFDKIRSIEAFRKTVPVFSHNDYDKLVKLDTEVGQRNVLTAKKLRAYAFDFNESDEVRTLPVSDDVCTVLGQKFMRDINGETTFLMMESMPRRSQLNDGTYMDSTVAILVRSALYNYFMSFQGFNASLTSPFSLLFPSEPIRTDYLNLLMALRNPDVTQIFAHNTWVVWNFIEMILYRGEDLCADIEQGKISISHAENNRVYKEISVLNAPNPERAEQIRKALACENKGDVLLRIWPKLKRVCALSGGKYKFYTKKVREYTGNIQMDTEELIASFGMVGEKTEEKGVYRLNVKDAFYEFLPVGDKKADQPKLLLDVDINKVYELLVTNADGLYRMHTGIYVRPVKKTSQGLWFEECQGAVIGEDGLICETDEMENALEQCIGDRLYEYYCYYNKKAKRLEFLIELVMDGLEIDYSAAIEQLLMQNDDYRYARENGLNACRARNIDKETHLLWRDIRRQKYNAPVDCFPPNHFIKINLVPVLKQWND